jgi:hypothetical protein
MPPASADGRQRRKDRRRHSLRGTGFAANTAIAISLKGGGTWTSAQSDMKGLQPAPGGAGEQGALHSLGAGGRGKPSARPSDLYRWIACPSPTPSLPPLPDPVPSGGVSLPALAIAGGVAALAWAVFVVAALARLRGRRSSD